MNFYKALIFGVSTLAVIGGYADNGFSLGEGGSDDELSKRNQNLRITDPNNNDYISSNKKSKSEAESDDDSKMDVDTPKSSKINPTEKDMEFLSGLNKFFKDQSKTDYPPTALLPIYEAALNGEVLTSEYLLENMQNTKPVDRFRIRIFLKNLSGESNDRKDKIPDYLNLFQNRLNALTKGASAIVDDEILSCVRLLNRHTPYNPQDRDKTYLQEFMDENLAGKYFEVSPTNLEKLKTYMSFMAYDYRVKIASLPDLFWDFIDNKNNKQEYEPWQRIAIHQMLASNDYVFYVDDGNIKTREKILKLIQSKVETFVNGGYQGYISLKGLQNQRTWAFSLVNDTLVVSQDELSDNKSSIYNHIKKNPDLKLLVDVKSIDSSKEHNQLSKDILYVTDLKHLILVNTNRDITKTPGDYFSQQQTFNNLDLRGMTALKTIKGFFMPNCEKLQNVQLPLSLHEIKGSFLKNSLSGDCIFIMPSIKNIFRSFENNYAKSLKVIAPNLLEIKDFCYNTSVENIQVWAPRIKRVYSFAAHSYKLSILDISSFPAKNVKVDGTTFLQHSKMHKEERKKLFEKISDPSPNRF